MTNYIANIILIEDDQQIRRFVSSTLENESFQVFSA
ncbi:MAG TPA: DNA-binding response regulator, partial [Methylophilaceae bacterium]|nr:DNA-binding response regulator [Methylophilaceae bacterium]